jgi:two-component system nitrogen regulation response regulator NtrX
MVAKVSKILIVDDEPDICEQLSGLLGDIGYVCEYATSSEKGLELFKKKDFSLVLLDIWLNNSKFDGFQMLEKILGIDQNIPVIMISGHGNIETAVNSIKKGAYDFIEKPFDSDLLIFKIKKALENLILKRRIEDFIKRDSGSKLVTNSKSTKNLDKEISQICKTDSNVLLIGSNGSGKEFIASKIHSLSHRSNKNFKFIDCRNDQEKLETDLFGFEENQIVRVLGVFDEINNGTLYLKNINLMSNKLQGKILRVLEEKKYYRIGALNSNSLNLRVIGSCNKYVKQKFLREDLLKKLHFNIIEVPGLDKRKEDVDELISIFSSKILLEKSLIQKKFSSEAISYLKNLDCFKNISQLKKFIEWIIIMHSDSDVIEISKNDLLELGNNLINFKHSYSNDSMNMKIKDAREGFEKNYLIYNLEKFEYNVSKMSHEIGMERTALYRKLKTLKIRTEL